MVKGEAGGSRNLCLLEKAFRLLHCLGEQVQVEDEVAVDSAFVGDELNFVAGFLHALVEEVGSGEGGDGVAGCRGAGASAAGWV